MNTIPDLRNARRNGSSIIEPFAIALDRLPPHSPEAEQGVLGCILLQPTPCLDEAVEGLTGKSEAFYDLRHKLLFEQLVAMSTAGHPIDIITVQQWLKDTQPTDEKGRPKEGNLLEMVGGIAYVASLPDAVPSAANLSYYANIVYEKHLLRKALQACTEVISRIYEHEGEVDALMDWIEREMLSIRMDTRSRDVSMCDLVHSAVNSFEAMAANKGALVGLDTGFTDLNRMTGGWRNGDMIVIAGRPSMGKSSIAMNMAEHVAVDLRIPVGVFSLEMTDESLVQRMIFTRARVNLRNLQEGFMAERDYPKLTCACGKISAAPLHIDDTGGISIAQLRAKARRMVQKYNVRLLIVDYIQLMQSGTRHRSDSKQDEVAEISKGIKNLAKELNIPIIAVSQLNRELDKDANRRPRLSDLRQSGQIEQDADVVGFLYRTRDDNSDPDGDTLFTKLYIAKQRNGPTGDINLVFLRNITRFESAAKIAAEDVPLNQ